jgi:hypothetical protein
MVLEMSHEHESHFSNNFITLWFHALAVHRTSSKNYLELRQIWTYPLYKCMLMIEKFWRWKTDFFKNFFAESKKETLGKEFLRQEPVGLLSAKNSSTRVLTFAKIFFTLDEEFFAESPMGGSLCQNFFYSRRRIFRREPNGRLSPKMFTHGEGTVSGSGASDPGEIL